MRLSRLLPMVVAAFLAVACNGRAQQVDAGLQEAEDTDLVVQPFDLTVEDVEEDAELLNQAGEEIGAIVSVLLDSSGRPAAISAEVGERTVVIGLDRLQADDDGDLVTALTQEELQRLPAWEG